MRRRELTLADRGSRPERTVVRLRNGVAFGGGILAVCAESRSASSELAIERTAAAVAAAGANVLSIGVGDEGLGTIRAAADRHGLAVLTEVVDPRDVGRVAARADMLQIGARNMQNFPLLREAGISGCPVLLQRGIAATVDEWLLAAEYVLIEGNPNVVLCERGVRSFDSATRNLLDLAVVPLLAGLTHLPVIVDPSHGTGLARLVEPMSLAAVAAGADGLLVEVQSEPADAASAGAPFLSFGEFAALTARLADVAGAVGRRLPQPGLAV